MVKILSISIHHKNAKKEISLYSCDEGVFFLFQATDDLNYEEHSGLLVVWFCTTVIDPSLLASLQYNNNQHLRGFCEQMTEGNNGCVLDSVHQAGIPQFLCFSCMKDKDKIMHHDILHDCNFPVGESRWHLQTCIVDLIIQSCEHGEHDQPCLSVLMQSYPYPSTEKFDSAHLKLDTI